MTEPDPLDALWQADEPPARDVAFTAAAMARMGAAGRRGDLARRALTGLGMGAAICGAMLLVPLAGTDAWALAVLIAALAGGFWAGGRLIVA